MKTVDKKRIEEFIRVDHAGERGAVKIYEGQLLTEHRNKRPQQRYITGNINGSTTNF